MTRLLTINQCEQVVNHGARASDKIRCITEGKYRPSLARYICDKCWANLKEQFEKLGMRDMI